MAQYDLGKVSIRPRGAYAANTNYEFLDSVQNLGGSWLALAASKDVQPGVTAGWQNYWMMFTKGIKTIAGSSAGSGQTTLTITFSDGSTQTYTYDNEVLADGSVGTAQLAPNAVTDEKIAVGAVTRTKLAQDALYSPIKSITAATYDIVADDLGKTLAINNTVDTTITMPNAVFSALPIGAEIAILPWQHNNTAHVTITLGSNYYLNKAGNVGTKGGSVATVDRYGMIACKKITGTSLLVIGNVEVVS